MGLQYAFPGLMTPRPVKFDTRIIADENGSLSLLLHAGKAGDVVNYCILVGGHRLIGYIKDPSYRYVNGLDHDKPRKEDFRVPQFSYITETLPDNVIIPKIDVNGCPMPITELCHDECRPAYFILKLQTTGLPIGDSIVEVSINGRRRNYIVTRPDFHIHRMHGHNLGRLYDKLMDLPDGAFDILTNNGKATTVDVHVRDKRLDDIEYIAFMRSKEASITLDFSWTDSGWITINVPQGVPTGCYKLAVTYTTDGEHWKFVTQGNLLITEREEDNLDVLIQPGVEQQITVDIDQYDIPYEDVPAAKAVWEIHLGDIRAHGLLKELLTGYQCVVGVSPNRDINELVDDINLRSHIGKLVLAVAVGEKLINLVALTPGTAANSYKFTAGSEYLPVPDNPCFGKGTLKRVVDGATEIKAATFRAIGYDADGNGQDIPCAVINGDLVITIPALEDNDNRLTEWTCFYSVMEGSWVAMSGGELIIAEDNNAYDSITRYRSYLYEVSYSELDYQFAYDYYKGAQQEENVGACTSIRKDNLLGRNYDWLYDDNAEFVVRTPNTLGVATQLPGLTEDFVNAGTYSALYKLVPFRLVDGINKYGLSCSVNVVPDNGSSIILPTGEQKIEICTSMLIRYILDNFTDAQSAVEWLGLHAKIYHPQSLIQQGYNVHYLLADQDSTWVIEFIDRKLHGIDITKGSDHPLNGNTWITNFHIKDVIPCTEEDYVISTPAIYKADPLKGTPGTRNKVEDLGAGLERYNLAAADNCELSDLLNKLRYTRTYQSSNDPAIPRWDTEFTGINNLTVNNVSNDFNTVLEQVALVYEERTRSNPSTWQTVHTSIYNLDERSLALNVQERYYTTYKFNLI